MHKVYPSRAEDMHQEINNELKQQPGRQAMFSLYTRLFAQFTIIKTYIHTNININIYIFPLQVTKDQVTIKIFKVEEKTNITRKMWDRRFGFRFPADTRDFYFPQVDTCSPDHPASYFSKCRRFIYW